MEEKNPVKTIRVTTTNTMTGHIADLVKPTLKLTDFQLSTIDTQAFTKMRAISDQYMLLKLACTEHSETVIDLKSYLTISKPQSVPMRF